ncbi:MAG: hypothetical protein IPK82_36540 [Polyangiaceae bacterium]|nr:hypothetical protein [Polyangiaceae bacterium]
MVSPFRKNLPIITVLFCQALLVGLCLLLYFFTLPAFAEAYKSYPGKFSFTTRLALQKWFLSGLPIVALGFDLLSLAAGKRSVRNWLLGMGLVIPAIGLAIGVDGLFAPLFQLAGP